MAAHVIIHDYSFHLAWSYIRAKYIAIKKTIMSSTINCPNETEQATKKKERETELLRFYFWFKFFWSALCWSRFYWSIFALRSPQVFATARLLTCLLVEIGFIYHSLAVNSCKPTWSVFSIFVILFLYSNLCFAIRI